MCGNQFNLNEAMSLGLNQTLFGNGPIQHQGIQPQPLDVLCGKQKQCVDHQGSRRFREVIECYREQYQQALTKWDKTSVTRNIYDHLSQTGSRFLRFDDKLKIWEEVSPMTARDKIGHALRFANRVTRRKRGASCVGFDTQSLPNIRDICAAQFVQPQSMPLGCMPTPSLATTPTFLADQLPAVPTPSAVPVVNEANTTVASFTPAQNHSQQLIQESCIPLERPEEWFQDLEPEDLKCPTKPTEFAEMEDSLSLLDGILSLNHVADPSKENDDLSFVDLDFDKEILSVLF